MIALYVKNRPWNGHPRCDFIRVITGNPLLIKGYRIDRTGARLDEEPTPNGYFNLYFAWYHPGTSWDIEEFKRLGGKL